MVYEVKIIHVKWFAYLHMTIPFYCANSQSPYHANNSKHIF